MTRMKESGIDWIGQIPEEWEVVRLQDIGDYKKGPFGSAITIDMFIEKSPGSYKVYEQKNAIRGNCEIGEAYIPKSIYNNLKNFSVYPLDIIVSCAGTIGKCYILPEDCEQGIINQALMRVRVNKSVNLEYFLYIFDIVLSYAAIKYSNGSAIKNIPPFNVLNKLRVTLPSNIEQHQIVNYLDKKTAQLDKAKALLEEQIQKLKDYRASLIYETVTKGLDKTVPMKDSGIDWIGQVPEGWEITKHKYIMTKVKEICAHYEGQDILSLTRQGVVVRDIESGKGKMPASFDGYQFLEKGDLLFCLFDIDVTPRCVGVVENNGLTSSAYSRFRLDDKISVYYYYYLFLSMDEDKVLLHLSKNLRHSLTEDDFGIIETVLPSYEEQLRIVDYLSKVTKSIDEIVQLKQKQIDNINKQRQTLIYDYVTGKRRV